MRYDIACTELIPGDQESLWATWTDLPSFPEWDPREQELRLDGPFAAGTTGWSKQRGRRPGACFTVRLVQQGERWVNECPLPGGALVIDHTLAPAGEGRVAVTKRYEVHGPMALLFRVLLSRGLRRDTSVTLRALGGEAGRRAAAS